MLFGARGRRVVEVSRRATEFAREERADADAVQELRQTAGGDEKVLRRAAGLYVQQKGYLAQRIHGLLESAASSGVLNPHKAMSAPEAALLRRVTQSPPSQAFRLLCEYVPQLQQLEADIRAEGGREEAEEAAAKPTAQWLSSTASRKADRIQDIRKIRTRVDALVGPDAWPDDTMLGSVFVSNLVFEYLLAATRWDLNNL